MIADTPFFSRLRQLFSSKAKTGASVRDWANTTRCIVRPSPLPLHLPRSSEPRPLPADHCLELASLRRGRERPFTERTVPSSGSVLLHAHNVRPNSFRVQPPPCALTKPTQGTRVGGGNVRSDAPSVEATKMRQRTVEVSSGGVVFRMGCDGPAVLLVRRTRSGRWRLPKGGVEPGEGRHDSRPAFIG